MINVYTVVDEMMLWDFRQKETLDRWYVLDDTVEVGGKSKARLEPNGKGMYVLWVPATHCYVRMMYCVKLWTPELRVGL